MRESRPGNRPVAVASSYLTTCWNCLGEFDALSAVWCSDDPKNPSKLCPFCFRCFCDANEKYKREFWLRAPQRLQDELSTLSKSKDRLGDVLIRMKKLTTPQLLDALNEQKQTGRKLGEILTERGLVKPDDIQSALRSQGVTQLSDTRGVEFSHSPVWDKSEPDAVILFCEDPDGGCVLALLASGALPTMGRVLSVPWKRTVPLML